MSIQRYTMRNVNGAPEMVAHEAGAYVTHKSHAEELHALQSELDALRKGLKRQVLAMQSVMTDTLIKTAIAATQTVYVVNPCNNLTAERVREMMDKQVGSCVIPLTELEEKELATGGFVSSREPMVRAGEVSTGRTVTTASYPKQDPKTLLCIKSEETSFVAGNRYQYEMKDGALFVTQDEFVSDLHEEDFWSVTDGGAYYIIESAAGSAYFKK